MSERVLVLCGLWLVGCGDRAVDVQFHAPAHCPDEVAVDCPMQGVGSLLVEVERTSGEVVGSRCFSRPEGLCDYEDLGGQVLLGDLAPTAGVEVRLEGYANEVCLGAADVFCCDSPGDHLVDLGSEAFPVDLWCSCVPRPVPCPR